MFMSFWDRLTKKNPPLRSLDNRMTITVESFKKQMESAYMQGHKDGAHWESKNKNGPSIFESIFGGVL